MVARPSRRDRALARRQRDELVGERSGNVEAALRGDFDESCRTGDVDLGQEVADDVQADHEQPVGCEARSDALRDFPVAFRQRSHHAASTRRKITPRFTLLGDACKRKRHDLAIEQQNALVAVGDLRDEALRHHTFVAVAAYGLDDDMAIRIVLTHAKNRRSAHAVERLEDDVAVLVDEGIEQIGGACDQRRNGKFRKSGDGHFSL